MFEVSIEFEPSKRLDFAAVVASCPIYTWKPHESRVALPAHIARWVIYHGHHSTTDNRIPRPSNLADGSEKWGSADTPSAMTRNLHLPGVIVVRVKVTGRLVLGALALVIKPPKQAVVMMLRKWRFRCVPEW